MEVSPTIKLAVEMGLGYLWQWIRGPKHIPNEFGYALFGLGAVFAWIWMTPDALHLFVTDWRHTLADMLVSVVSMVLTARGTASTASDTGVAPKTNTL